MTREGTFHLPPSFEGTFSLARSLHARCAPPLLRPVCCDTGRAMSRLQSLPLHSLAAHDHAAAPPRPPWREEDAAASGSPQCAAEEQGPSLELNRRARAGAAGRPPHVAAQPRAELLVGRRLAASDSAIVYVGRFRDEARGGRITAAAGPAWAGRGSPAPLRTPRRAPGLAAVSRARRLHRPPRPPALRAGRCAARDAATSWLLSLTARPPAVRGHQGPARGARHAKGLRRVPERGADQRGGLRGAR